MDEHGKDRKLLEVDANSEQPRLQPVQEGKRYRFKVERANGRQLIAPPTRTGVRAYEEIRHELEQAAGNINGRYAEMDWVPIRYLNKGYDRGIIMTMLRVAKVGLVTSVRDGMNLVAKEYVASQDPEDPGVLVLSRLCGAAEELGDAVLVNPYDIDGVADGIQTALEMPLAERRARYERMIATLGQNDIHSWCERFLKALQDARHE
jgi:trehalose 6-phosphate synthase